MIICGTGHRPDKLGGYGDDIKNKLQNLATGWLISNKNINGVISGMALGWDQALASAAISLRVPLLAALPFKNQDCKWPEKSQKEFKNILNKASKIVIVSEGEFTSKKMQIRNEYMVDNSDFVLALWNGTSGGTANCIKYAAKKNKLIVNLWKQYAT